LLYKLTSAKNENPLAIADKGGNLTPFLSMTMNGQNLASVNH